MAKAKSSRRSPRFQDITGQTFGYLVAIRFVGKNKNGRTLWEFRCNACGSLTIKAGVPVKRGHTKSCGCRHWTGAGRKHGLTGTRAWSAWHAMRQRCNNPKNAMYRHYGGRGIRICDQWRTFDDFFADMGAAPSDKHTIDRINNDGPYSPENCRWATRAEQCLNQRSNHLLTYDGRTMPLGQWAKEIGLRYGALLSRIRKGWSVERALTTPPLN